MKHRNPISLVSLAFGVMWIGACAVSKTVREQMQAPVMPQAGTLPEGSANAPGSERPTITPSEAIALLREGRLEEGREALQKIVRDSGSKDAIVYYNLAIAEERLGRREAAIEAARKAVEVSEAAETPLWLYFDLMIRAGKSDQLVSDLEGFAERWPDAISVVNALARALIEAGRPTEGLRLASDLLKKDETNVAVMKTIAMAYLAMRKTEAAKIIMGQILETQRDAEVLALLGQIALREGEKRQAMAYLRDALSLNPDLVDAHLNLGVLYHEAGDYEAAIAEFQQAIQIEPTYWPAYMNLGNAYRRLGQFDLAEEAFNKALKINPDCADCYYNLGIAALEYRPLGRDEPGHYRKAIEYFAKYKTMRRGPPKPDDPVDKYIDEARRMAEHLEEVEMMREPMENEQKGGESGLEEKPEEEKAP